MFEGPDATKLQGTKKQCPSRHFLFRAGSCHTAWRLFGCCLYWWSSYSATLT